MRRRPFPGLPVVMDGMGASIRRVVHQDYREDKLRLSILADAKAEILVPSLGEVAIREIAARLRDGHTDLSGIRMDVALCTPEYLRALVQNHVSGHPRVTPEHLCLEVLRRMRKPAGDFPAFLEKFREEESTVG